MRIKNKKKVSSPFLKNKKGLNEVIGYVLLIAVSITISILVYQFLKTYVPKEALACPGDTSVFIKNYTYNCLTGDLTITLQNKGKFGIAGFFIHSSVSTNPELATIDLSGNLTAGGIISGSTIVYANGNTNGFNPEDIPKTSTFNVKKIMQSSWGGTLTKIEIIPTRYQLQDNFWKYVSCSDAKVGQQITCTPQ